MHKRGLAALLGTFLIFTGLASAPSTASQTRVGQAADSSRSSPRKQKVDLWVVPVNLADGRAVDRGKLRAAVNETVRFFAVDSNGLLSLKARTLPTVTSTSRGCSPPVTSISRRVARKNKRINNEKDVVVLAFPDIGDCDEVGVGGDSGFAWKSAACWDSLDSAHCLRHELGHALYNLHHDNRITCEDENGKPIVYGGSCILDEYRNPYTVMGNSYNGGGLHAADLISEGLRPNSSATFAAESRTVTLTPRSRPSGTLSLVVPLLNRGGGSGGARSRLELEYRTATGTDSWLGDNTVAGADNPGTGVLVSLAGASPFAELDRHPSGDYSFGDPLDRGLLNMHPERSEFTPAMHAGDSWAAPDGSVRITVMSETPEAAVVRVDHAQDTKAPYPFKLGRPSQFSLGQKSRVFIGFGTPGDNVAVRRFKIEISGQKSFYVAGDRAVQRVSQGEVMRVLPRGRYTVRVTAEDYSGNKTRSNQRVVVVR